jgi:integrase
MRKLTALILPTLPLGEHSDHACPGLLFVVSPRQKAWQLRYRAGGVRKRLRLGYFPKMSLLEARTAAANAMNRIEAGSAPAAELVVHPRRDALSLGTMIDRYEALRRREGADGRYFVDSFRIIRTGLKDFLTMPAAQFSKADLRAARDRIGERAPYAANKFLGCLGPLMRWAAQEDLVPTNFVGDLRKFEETSRDRVLTHDEIARIWNAGEQPSGGQSARAFGRMVRFALVTLQRRDECATLRHGDILGGVWRQERNKASRPHRLRLPALALDLIGQGEAQEFCFASINGQISGFSKLKAQLDRLSGVAGWRLHDLRRTGASQMQELGISRDVIQGVLNHAISDVGGVYLRGEMQAAKGEALAAWAAELERIIGAKRATH